MVRRNKGDRNNNINNTHMFSEKQFSKEVLLKYLLLAASIVLILVCLSATSEVRRLVSSAELPLAEVAEQGDAETRTETLIGTIVAVDKKNSYIRVMSSKDGKIYSVAVPQALLMADTPSFAPSDMVSIKAEILSDTEQTDFTTSAVTVTGAKKFPHVNSGASAE